jgi:hypothetical protein
MELPQVSNPIRDDGKNVTYNVIAYRKLSRNEIVQAVRYYHSQKKTKKLKNGTTVKIVTIIGHND